MCLLRTSKSDDVWIFVEKRTAEIEALVEAELRRAAAREQEELHFSGQWKNENPPPQTDNRALARTLLDVQPGATDEEITRAFRQQMLRHHPDHGGDPVVARSLTMAKDALLR
jgi:DnaJ-domain-containing protein 1